MIKKWLDAHPQWRVLVLTLYYLAVIFTLLAIYGKGDFSTPGFVYQEF